MLRRVTDNVKRVKLAKPVWVVLLPMPTLVPTVQKEPTKQVSLLVLVPIAPLDPLPLQKVAQPPLELQPPLANHVLWVKRVRQRVTDNAVLVRMESPRLVVSLPVRTIVKIVRQVDLKLRVVLLVNVVCVSKEPMQPMLL